MELFVSTRYSWPRSSHSSRSSAAPGMAVFSRTSTPSMSVSHVVTWVNCASADFVMSFVLPGQSSFPWHQRTEDGPAWL